MSPSRERSILLAIVGATGAATVVATVGVVAALGGFPTEVPAAPLPAAVVVPVGNRTVPVAPASAGPGCASRTVAVLPAGSAISG